MEREVGGGIGMGNTCKPMAVSFQCMTKFTRNKKKKKKKSHGIYLSTLSALTVIFANQNVIMSFPGGEVVKNPSYNAGDARDTG